MKSTMVSWRFMTRSFSLALYIDDPIELAVALLATVLFCVVEYTKDLLIFYLEIVWQRYSSSVKKKKK